MATRTIDLFGVKFGDSPGGGNAVQRVGPSSLRLTHGFPPIVANNDGVAGVAAQDQGQFSCRADLACQDLSTLASVLAAFEGASGGRRALIAETKEVGAATVTRILMRRAILTGARLSLRAGGYGDVGYNFRSSCDPASNSQEDELSFTGGQTKTTTIAGGKRMYRTISAIHGGSIQAYACSGLDLNITGQVAIAPPGDGEFGETVEVGGWDVSGVVSFADYDVASSLSRSQALIAANPGDLVAVLRQQGGSVNTTLTLKNTRFFDVDDAFAARQYGQATLRFRCAFVSGTTPFLLATGLNKVIGMT